MFQTPLKASARLALLDRLYKPIEISRHEVFNQSGLKVQMDDLLSKTEDPFPRENLEEQSSKTTYCSISSIVGDDEQNTTNSILYARLSLRTASVVSGVKISEHDLGISKKIANYAEGWLLTPASADSSFESVNRYHKGDGIPLTLDPVKLKYLSPVRKQTSAEAEDFESKYSHLSQIAEWVHELWPTYDFHQTSLILASCCFDFQKARSYPFMYKSEGGCGGTPPYGNIATAICTMYHFRRGKSTQVLLNLIKESIDVLESKIAPKDIVYLKMIHLAQAGDQVWLKEASRFRQLLAEGKTRQEVRDEIRRYTLTSINPELQALGEVIEPEDILVGSALSNLRKEGYIYTELDIKVLEQAQERERALDGRIPIGEIISRQKIDLREFKKNTFKLLHELFPPKAEFRMSIDDMDEDEFLPVLKRYYYHHIAREEAISSFIYTDSIRIFKTTDVDSWFSRGNMPLKRDFGGYTSKKAISDHPEIPIESRKFESITQWLNTGHIQDLVTEIPFGLGTEDARILKKIANWQPDYTDGRMRIIMLFSSDRSLQGLVRASLNRKAWTGEQVYFQPVPIRTYIQLCVLSLIPTEEKMDIEFYNSIAQRKTNFPKKTIQNVLMGIGIFRYSDLVINQFYDVANIWRSICRYEYSEFHNSVRLFGGGYLQTNTISYLPEGSVWAALSLDEILQWQDFDDSVKTVHLNRFNRTDILKGASNLSNDPNRSQGVTQWLRKAG